MNSLEQRPDEIARDAPGQPFVLAPRQESLREALAAQSAQAAALYVGGLMILANDSNPCSVRLAGAAMRELIDELARAGGVAHLRGGSLKDRVNALRDRVDRRRTVLSVDAPAPGHVAKLLEDLADFFRRYDEINPSRKVKARQTVIAISIDGRNASDVVTEPLGERLLKLSDAFSRFLHHPEGGDRDEFHEVLTDFEQFLLDRLTPDTFDDFATIDDLIALGPPDA